MPASLQRQRSARTVLLRMAADEERARRIRDLKNALKQADPTKTVGWIADQLGVTERSVSEWSATGAIGYPNCVKLAELVFDVDPGWLWRGEKGATPDLMATLREAGAGPSQLDRIEVALDEALKLLRQLAGAELPAPPSELFQPPADRSPRRGTSRRDETPPAAGSQ